MRIAYLSDSIIPSRKANGIQVMNMCQAFAQAGHEVVLFARPGESVKDDFEFYGVPPEFEIVKTPAIGPRRVRDWVYASLTAQKFKRRGPFHLVYGRSLPALAAVARGSLPFIYEAHQPASLTGRAVERLLFRRPNMVRTVFISDGLRTAYLNSYPQLRQLQTLVAHDGTKISSTAADQGKSDTAAGPLRVGYSGSLYPGRGIEIICALAARMAHLNFHICGGSSAEVIACKSSAADCDNLTFHGFLPPSQVAEWQRSMDVLLAPYQESVPTVAWMSPLKIFEYMASGRAIIASDLPALREVLTDGENSLLVPSDDVTAWIEAMNRLDDLQLRESVGLQAIEDIRAKYTWEQRTINVLKGIPSTSATTV